MGGKRKVIILMGLGAFVGGSGLACGYFGLREVLAPQDSSLVRRVGLAGVYLVERDGQKFLINSLGGMAKIESPTVPTSISVDARPSSSPIASELNALPTPPATSYAAHILELYRQSLLDSKQCSENAALMEQQAGDSPVGTPPKRSSFVKDRKRKDGPQTTEATPAPSPIAEGMAAMPTPSPGAEVTPAPTASPSPMPKILKSIEKASALAPTPSPIAQPSSANDKVTDAFHPSMTDTSENTVKRHASWAGFLAAQNIIHPPQSAILVLRPPGTSQSKAVSPADTALSDRAYTADNDMGSLPRTDGTETYTILKPSPTPSPDDLVPSASPSPTPWQEPEPEPTSNGQPKSHPKPAKSVKKPAQRADNKPSFWQMIFHSKLTGG
jgi:hypothetical protein